MTSTWETFGHATPRAGSTDTMRGALRPLATHALAARCLGRCPPRARLVAAMCSGAQQRQTQPRPTANGNGAPPPFRRDALPYLLPHGTPFGQRRGHASRGDARTHVTGLSDPLPEDLLAWTDRPLVTHLRDGSKTRRAAGEVAERLAEQLTPSPANRIFCNRSLNMQHITAVGFDMDYTLAIYKPETFEVLAYTLTCEKLVNVYGYPREILEYRYDHEYMVRGLVVDKKRGNILKMDRHKYVKVARHGFRPMDAETRIKTYNATTSPGGVDRFDGANYANVDTLFSLGETYLFCQLVELKERLIERGAKAGGLTEAETALTTKPFIDVYSEIRASVDLCHRDGSLKAAVANDPEKYIHRDDALVPMLEALRSAGKKVFLLTNSLWDFTNVVMNHLVHGASGEDKTAEWTELFDAVVTGSCKPGFFENERAAIFEVDVQTSALKNTDDGAPMTPIGASAAASQADAFLATAGARAGTGKNDGVAMHAKAYQGGSYRHLHSMLGVSSGAQVLYVGDHIYGDILRSKKTLGWRTMLVVPELAHEMECLERAVEEDTPGKLRDLRRRRTALEDALQLAEFQMSVEKTMDDDAYDALVKDATEARLAHREELRRMHAEFHPIWGQMMKAGNQNSRFAHQLERYACLYTSHARNLLAYSPAKSYRGLSDAMPHDMDENV